MQYARALLVFICLFLCACRQYVGRLPEFAPNPYATPKQWHVFVSGDRVPYDTSAEWPASQYNGVTFPVYYGYIYSKDDVVYFVKKTPLLFPALDSFREELLAEQRVRTPLPDMEFKYVPDRKFWITLWRYFERIFPGTHGIIFTGPPDDNYQPRFRRTCTFNADAGQLCTQSFLPETQPELALIPTANEVLPHLYKYITSPDGGPPIKHFIEYYNTKSGAWERKPDTWREYDQKTSRWKRVYHWQKQSEGR